MFEAIMLIAWVLGIILGIMWLFLPWIIIAKMDEMIEELKTMTSSYSKLKGERS